jgi:hypothetical protein
MTDRYDPSDRQIYGAEDDDEMDMILDYIDAALKDTAAHDDHSQRGDVPTKKRKS